MFVVMANDCFLRLPACSQAQVGYGKLRVLSRSNLPSEPDDHPAEASDCKLATEIAILAPRDS